MFLMNEVVGLLVTVFFLSFLEDCSYFHMHSDPSAIYWIYTALCRSLCFFINLRNWAAFIPLRW